MRNTFSAARRHAPRSKQRRERRPTSSLLDWNRATIRRSASVSPFLAASASYVTAGPSSRTRRSFCLRSHSRSMPKARRSCSTRQVDGRPYHRRHRTVSRQCLRPIFSSWISGSFEENPKARPPRGIYAKSPAVPDAGVGNICWQEVSAPLNGDRPKSLPEFASDEVVERFVDANLTGFDLSGGMGYAFNVKAKSKRSVRDGRMYKLEATRTRRAVRPVLHRTAKRCSAPKDTRRRLRPCTPSN